MEVLPIILEYYQQLKVGNNTDSESFFSDSEDVDIRSDAYVYHIANFILKITDEARTKMSA